MKILRSSLLAFFSVFFFVSSAVTSAANSTDDFLQCLSLHSFDDLQMPEALFTARNSSFLSIFESSVRNPRFRWELASILKPVAIIVPQHESHIQAAIYCCIKHNIRLRIRSGGHDYEGLSYISKTPFVLIDMRNFRSVSVDTENRTAWIQAGATLGELYHGIAEKSPTLAFSAGVCPTVGVGGHFSGGGYGMISRKYGIAADNIIDAKIIVVSGRILDRSSMEKDLFWAIRGGGGASFGVILAWKVKLLRVPRKVTVFNVTRSLEQNTTNLVHRWQEIAHKIDRSLLIRLFVKSVSSSQNGKRTIVASFTSLYLGGANKLLQLMQREFPELGLLKRDCLKMSWIESTLYFYGVPDRKNLDTLLNRATTARSAFKGKSDFINQPIPKSGLEKLWKWLHKEDEGRSHYQLSPYGGRLDEISESEIPFPHRSGNLYMIHYLVDWFNDGSMERHLKWIQGLYDDMAPYVSKSPRGVYFNYRDLDMGVNGEGSTSYADASIWGEKYFKNNFDRLVRVKTIVDPMNFFRNEQSIPPLASS
ncbi:UNVERIFIED_CONTAM: Berberine bridge enzyme-like 18 [Sesamum radiatum]|uniref:Berberine bridge enzyme-like 18 n=1 Tax=Sesamum radiatum TaxID=300843 RepID=A0AAW2KEI6_SESRA